MVNVRWSQLGFGRTSSTDTGQATPRNLFGFKDGTDNLKAEDDAELDRYVWVGEDDAGWLVGGSYLVTRRIRMHIEPWDSSALEEQEKTIGRAKGSSFRIPGGASVIIPAGGAHDRWGNTNSQMVSVLR